MSAGQKLAVHLIDAELCGHAVGYALGVTRQHDGLLDACLFELGNGFLRVRLDDVGDDDVARVLAVDGHMDDRADAVAAAVLDPELFHELAVACGDGMAVDLRGDAVAADLFDLRHAAAVDLMPVGLLQTLADGVRGSAFGQRGVFEQLLLIDRAVVNSGDLKHALRQRAGLVKDHDL